MTFDTIVAAAVSAPDRVLTGRRALPGDVIATAGNLHRADRGPTATELASRHRRAAVFELRAQAAAAGGVEE